MRRIRAIALPWAATLAAAVSVVAAQTADRPRGPEPVLVIEPIRGIYGHLLEGPFLQPSGVYYDRHQNEIFICDAGGRRIAIADDRGFPTFSLGSPKTLISPKRVAVDPSGRILVADVGYQGIRVFDYDGQVLRDLDLSGVPRAQKPLQASALALGEGGRLYILDAGNRRVVATGLDGSRPTVFQAPPGRKDLLQAPSDLDLTPEGNLAISDGRGLPVQIYEPSGKFVRGWGDHDVGLSSFSLPSGIAVDGEGRVYVADSLRQDIKVFSAKGEFLTNFGGWGTRPGQVRYPVDVASDKNDRVFVAERVGSRVQIYRVREPLRAVGDIPQSEN